MIIYHPEPDPTEQAVIDRAMAGQSVTEIGAAVFGNGQKSGRFNNRVREILAKHGY
jgi:hypothetical protein